jgi:hypothetical protein
MRRKKKRPNAEERAEFIARVRGEQAQREQSYREQALAMFPHVCAKCGREFSGKSLRELTVHHKDSNHMNNPPDGSNWELLCLYCHDDEHGGFTDKVGYSEGLAPDSSNDSPLGFRAFEGLDALLEPKDDDTDSEKG